jgi:DNA primase
VSAPLRWTEVAKSLDVARFTIETMTKRLASMKNDPLLSLLADEPDIRSGLEQLSRIAESS